MWLNDDQWASDHSFLPNSQPSFPLYADSRYRQTLRISFAGYGSILTTRLESSQLVKALQCQTWSLSHVSKHKFGSSFVWCYDVVKRELWATAWTTTTVWFHLITLKWKKWFSQIVLQRPSGMTLIRWDPCSWTWPANIDQAPWLRPAPVCMWSWFCRFLNHPLNNPPTTTPKKKYNLWSFKPLNRYFY